MSTQQSSEAAPNRAKFLADLSKSFPVWPAVLCWFVLLVMTTVGLYAMDHNFMGMRAWRLETALIGVILGQFGLATIIGGLCARNWVTSWFLIVLLICFHTLVGAFAMNNTITEWFRHMAVCGIWPAMMLSTCAPLIALRPIFGWTLSRQPNPAIGRWSSSLEDLLFVGVVVGCVITFTQVFMFTEGPQNLAQVLLVMGVFAALSFVCVPPTVYVTFRAKSWGWRLMGWLVLSAITFGVVFVEAAVMDGGIQQSIRNLPDMVVGVSAGCITTAIGLICIMASGYTLTYFEKTSPEPFVEDELEADDVTDETNDQANNGAPFEAEWLDDSETTETKPTFDFGPKWQARIIVALLICIAAIGVGAIYIAKQRLLRVYEQLSSSDLLHVTTKNKVVTGIHFGSGFTDTDLRKYVKYADTVTSLSFAGTKVTDAIMDELKPFRRLESLDLSRTAITDEGLKKFGSVNWLRKLSVADTKLSWSAIQEFCKSHSIVDLDVAGLQITDEQLKVPLGVGKLGLARNPITDDGVATLLEGNQLARLDLSDTAITGSTLKTLQCPESVILDGTQINDANLLAILSLGKVRKLSLARTNVTAAVLPKLANRSVRLGQGLITENDLANAGPLMFTYLGLNDKQFTGQCLLGGTLGASSLDLSNSSITDDIAGSLRAGGWRNYINLANTQITDRALNGIMAGQVDLRGTRVTAEGLSTRQSYFTIVVSHNQFTPKEMVLLHRTNVSTDAEPIYGDEAP